MWIYSSSPNFGLAALRVSDWLINTPASDAISESHGNKLPTVACHDETSSANVQRGTLKPIMASNGISSQMDNLDLSDTEDLFASPSEKQKTRKPKSSTSDLPNTPSSSLRKNATPSQSKYDNEEAREAALRKELAGIRNINHVVEGVVESLEKATGNMDV